MKLFPLCLILSVAFLAVINAAPNKVVCYYGSWTDYRTGEGQSKIEDLDPKLCTHLIYGFVGLTEQGEVKMLDQWLAIDKKAFERFNALKKANPSLKTLVAIGGWNEDPKKYSDVTKDPVLRKKFVKSATEFVKEHGFNGFDLDWEYPAQRGGIAEDKANYIELIKELRAEFDKHKFLLTAAVGASKHHRDASYDVKKMSQYLDFINVMAYDLHYFGEGATGFNAPLYGSSFDKAPELNVNDVVEGWLKDGAKPEKLVLGLGLYGRTFKLSDPSKNFVGAQTSGPGNKGDVTKEDGTFSYMEICKQIKFDKWQSKWDDKQQVPYAFSGDQWVGYDNVKSLEAKVDLAKKYNLGGVMVWSIEQDDIRNVCGGGNYPLLTAINKRLGSKSSPVVELSNRVHSDEASTTTTTEADTTTVEIATVTEPDSIQKGYSAPSENSDNIPECNGKAFVPDPSSCQKFYRCQNDGLGGVIKIQMQCPDGLAFDQRLSLCNYPQNVVC